MITEEKQEELLQRLKKDDRSALKELFQLSYPSVCKAIKRLVREQAITEDLAQEVFLRFWKKRHSINVTSSLSAYLNRMATNEALGYLRRKKKLEGEEHINLYSKSTDPDAEGIYMEGELKENIRTAINELPTKCRTVFVLSRYDELTYQEIADKMDISVKTVENQMGKALKVLRQKLKSYLSFFL